ncbi:hypothetical protein ACO0RG_000096 [Hanseniaspora osmophila]
MSEFHKHQRKQQNSKRLSKLAFYCQICQKQCRDDNGYRQHLRSPHHLKMKSKITSKDIAEYNDLFEKSFLQYLRLFHGEKWVNANKVYNAFIINDKDHVHMNSTKWSSLTKFVQHLGKAGKVHVQLDENEQADFYSKMDNNDAVNCNSLMISYVDTSSETLLRKAQVAQLERDNLTEQESRALLLQKQMDDAKKLLEKEEEEEEEEGAAKDDETTFVEPLGKISLVTSSRVGKPKGKKFVKKKKNVFE